MASLDFRLLDAEDRPSLRSSIDALVAANLPEFMMWASPGNWRWHRIYERYPAFQVAAVDRHAELLGAINAVPLEWSGEAADLPGGYDDVLVATTDGPDAASPTAICLLSVSVSTAARGRRVADALLSEMKRRAFELGLRDVIAPLRPTHKCRYPTVPMTSYASWTNEAGEAFDPWLRTHLRLGARVLGVAERSLVVSQPRARWERLIGAPIPGQAACIDGALALVQFDDGNTGTYVEPNVWIGHAAEPRRLDEMDLTSRELNDDASEGRK